ncbi:MAG: ABC transporter permease [Nitrospinae bacterium]|nr:ABC transporter permease [Nitrospinota bacterium]
MNSRLARFVRSTPLAALGLLILLVLVVVALFAPYISPYDPTAIRLAEGLSGPSITHPLGQDKLGRDILSRIIYGARISLYVGVATVMLSAFVGTVVGAVSGYAGGVVDEVVMRLIDILLAFPGILLAVAVMAILGPSLNNIVIALTVLGWVGYARLVRGQVLALREFEFVLAARALGADARRIITRHLLPNVLGPVIVQATFGMAGAIVAEAGLSFLGLGTQPPTPSWGSMLNDGREFLLTTPHLTTFPGLAIMTVVLGLNFLGDGLRDILDPKSRAR